MSGGSWKLLPRVPMRTRIPLLRRDDGVLQSVLQSDAPKLVVILTLEKVGEVMRSMKTQWLLLRVRWRNDMCR